MLVNGHYNGSVVVLCEPAPVDHAVDVTVHFPDETLESAPTADRWWDGRFHWALPRPEGDNTSSDSTVIVRNLRDAEP
jgi:hypothetical protein